MTGIPFIFFLLLFLIKSDTIPDIRLEDKIRIAEAFRIAEHYGNKLWKDWDKAPFALLLIYDENEFLINHPNPSNDFKSVGFDSLLKSNIYYRHKTFNTNLLATFPAVNGLSTIVMGIPENTGKSSSDWIITILHEHFHQLQYSQADYYSGVNELNLSGGDESGMWMLNYPFPYEDEKINRQYKILTGALLKLLIPFPPDSRLFNRDLSTYLEERKIFKELLDEKDYKYFSFQLWQEGIARYTEYKLADMISHFEPSAELKDFKDYKSFYEVADELRENIFNQLKAFSLKDNGRICFYSFGAGEGILLDRINKNWKEKYLVEQFFLEEYYPE